MVVILNTGVTKYITTNDLFPDAALEKFRCPLGWWLRDKSCYHVTSVAQTHDQSQLECASMGGELVRIETAAEQQAVSDVIYGLVYLLHLQEI